MYISNRNQISTDLLVHIICSLGVPPNYSNIRSLHYTILNKLKLLPLNQDGTEDAKPNSTDEDPPPHTHTLSLFAHTVT